MASTLSIGPEQQRIEGRTVRDIVEHDPAQVNENWCRKIFRQLLQSLELQYAMHMPHRAITPDTVVFHDNGEPLLLPSGDDASDGDEAADLTALARVVHFAITRELVPDGPLRGRALDGYSDSLVTAVDRCMSDDPAQRPHSIDELRHILGIVSLGPSGPAGAAMPAAAAAAPAREPAIPAAAPLEPDTLPSFMQAAAPAPLGAGLTRWQRWAIAAGGGAVLVAIALAVFAELRDSGSYDHIVLTLPQSGDQARDRPRAAALPPPADEPAAPAQPQQPPAALQADANGAPAPEQPVAADAPMPAAAAPGAPHSGTTVAPARPQAAATGSATYKLRIQPWGIVYVDGVDRGASPPVKRLTLTPGRHTIRIANPNFHDRVLEVDTRGGNGQIAVDFSDEPR
jgi:hypothetical protein